MNKNTSCCSLAATLTLVFLAVACNIPVTRSQITATPQSTVVPVIVTRLAALIEGRLSFENGCLRVGANGDQAFLIVWPVEYAAAIEGDMVKVTTGQLGGEQQVIKLMIGSHVRLGGGTVSVGQLEPDLRMQLPPQCDDKLVWVVGTIYETATTPPP